MNSSSFSRLTICPRVATAGRTASFVMTAMSLSPSESVGSAMATISAPSWVKPIGAAW